MMWPHAGAGHLAELRAGLDRAPADVRTALKQRIMAQAAGLWQVTVHQTHSAERRRTVS